MTAGTETTILPPFTVTRAAIEELTKLGGAVRIDVERGGCCGSTYTFAQVDPDDPTEAEGTAYGCPGAWLVVSDAAEGILPGATLDYSAHLKPPRFRVLNNPNTEHTCPCRRSFGREWPGPRQPSCRSYQPMTWDEDFEPPAQWRRQTGYER